MFKTSGRETSWWIQILAAGMTRREAETSASALDPVNRAVRTRQDSSGERDSMTAARRIASARARQDRVVICCSLPFHRLTKIT